MTQTGYRRNTQLTQQATSLRFDAAAIKELMRGGNLPITGSVGLPGSPLAKASPGAAAGSVVKAGSAVVESAAANKAGSNAAAAAAVQAAPVVAPARPFEIPSGDALKGAVSRIAHLGDFLIPAYMRNDVIISALAQGFAWDPNGLKAIREHVKPGHVVVDVGAFNGCLTVPLSRLVGPEGRVYAFEPQDDIRAQLTANLMLNALTNVSVSPNAAGNAEGSVRLYVNATNRGGSSVHFGADTKAGFLDIRQVALDAVLPDAPVHFMKIDVSGSEYELIQGARKLLTKYLPVLYIEVWPDHKRTQEKLKTTRADVFTLLEAIGYQTPSVNSYNWDHLILPRRL